MCVDAAVRFDTVKVTVSSPSASTAVFCVSSISNMKLTLSLMLFHRSVILVSDWDTDVKFSALGGTETMVAKQDKFEKNISDCY